MKETIVSFETAKLAKEKGFNWECENYYYGSGVDHTSNIPITNFCDIYDSNSLNRPIYIAPTQSLLQKWLREEHDIDITIHRSFSMVNSYHYCIIVDNEYDDENQQEICKNRSYEEALEDALIEAQKFIKKKLM